MTMKLISISSRRFLGGYISQNYNRRPDLFLCSGILLILLLLSIFSSVWGPLSLIIIACVLQLGFGLGVVLKRFFPFQPPPCITGTLTLTPSTKLGLSRAA